MNRRETTDFLSKLLVEDKFNGMGKYWAKEVSIDYGTRDVKRVDFMQFVPPSQCSISDIEKGHFVCYEIKSCKEDVYSGNGLNFFGEKNYIVTTMQCYKDLLPDLRDGTFTNYLLETYPHSSVYFGIIVAIPFMSDISDEFENPTDIKEGERWELRVIQQCRPGLRKRSITELLFCMLRSRKN